MLNEKHALLMAAYAIMQTEIKNLQLQNQRSNNANSSLTNTYLAPQRSVSTSSITLQKDEQRTSWTVWSCSGTPIPKTKKEPAPTPVFVDNVTDFNYFKKSLEEKLDFTPNFTNSNNGTVKIKIETAIQYRDLIIVLKSMKERNCKHNGGIEFHIYRPK